MKIAANVIKHKGYIQDNDIAIQVAEKCGGLPLFIVTVAVAGALKGKNKLD